MITSDTVGMIAKFLCIILTLVPTCMCQVGVRSRVGRLKDVVPETASVTEHVWFDFIAYDYYKVHSNMEGRFVIAVFGDVAPMTTLNFISLAKGYRRGQEMLTYNRTYIHRIVPDFVLQMGDLSNQRGTGGTSIYGPTFRDEDFILSHSSSGIVSMANSGKDTNNSQFFITLQKAKWLDGHHVVFGKIVAGMDWILKLGEIQSYNTGHPRVNVKIVNCGVEGIKVKYHMNKHQMETNSEEIDVHDLGQDHDDEDEEDEEDQPVERKHTPRAPKKEEKKAPKKEEKKAPKKEKKAPKNEEKKKTKKP